MVGAGHKAVRADTHGAYHEKNQQTGAEISDKQSKKQVE